MNGYILPRVICIIVILLNGVGDGMAQVPAVFSYQGLLTEDTGEAKVGPVKLVLKFYNQASGGAVLFQETHHGVPLNGGVFSVMIGSETIGGLPDSALDAGEVWLEVSVDNGGGLSPRTRLVMVPYARKSILSEGLVRPDSFERILEISDAGRVGIGTDEAVAKLDVRGRMTVGDAFVAGANESINVVNLIAGVSDVGSHNGISFYDAANGEVMHFGFDASAGDDLNALCFYNRTGDEIWRLDQRGHLNIDSSTLYVDAGMDSVGIGTDTPEAKLHVAGDLKVDGEIITNGQEKWYSGSFASFQTLDPTTSLRYGPFAVEGTIAGEIARGYSPVILPDGAVIERFITHVQDKTDEGEVFIILGRTRYANPVNQNLVEIHTTDGNTLIPYEVPGFLVDTVVDNEKYHYWVQFYFTTPSTPGDIKVMGYRIKYRTN